MFLYIDPLKQGLKPQTGYEKTEYHEVFIHRSIKTRIETWARKFRTHTEQWFLYIDPLKQGLKLREIK